MNNFGGKPVGLIGGTEMGPVLKAALFHKLLPAAFRDMAELDAEGRALCQRSLRAGYADDSKGVQVQFLVSRPLLTL